jgi:ABC-type iron transport system FetAB ATPase subunit
VALQVFTEMTEVRLATLRALSLLQRHQVQFTGDRSRAIADLCTALEAAIAFIRDLTAGPYTALNDDALQAFLDESEKKLR